jgi:hypothetical protein
MNGERSAYRSWLESQKEKDHWEYRDLGGWIVLRWILGRKVGGGVDWIGLTQGEAESSCEQYSFWKFSIGFTTSGLSIVLGFVEFVS